VSWNLLAAVSLLASTTWAQTSVSSTASTTAPSTEEQAQVRLRYGVSVRNGSESDSGPGLTYSGVTPSDLELGGWLWFLLGDHLGLTAHLHREAFSLLDGQTNVAAGSLLRASVGPTARIRLGPARFEAAASYGFAQLPVFGTLSAPVFSTVQRHGVLLAARALVDLGPVTVEGRFEYPIALATVGRAATSQGLGAGGGVRVQLFRTGMLRWGVLGDVQWQQDSVSSTDLAVPLSTTQSAIRAGLAIDVQVKDPKSEIAPKTGAISVRVKSDDGPLAGVRVTVKVGSQPTRELSTGPDGTVALDDLEPGELVASARLNGYESGEARTALGVGETRTLDIVLNKEKLKVGALLVKTISFDGKAPVEATIDLNGQSLKADASGTVTVDRLAPGPLAIKASAPGYKVADETASVVAGRTSELTITLVPEKKKIPATLSGQVRNARGGKSVAARLEIRELKQTIDADAAGSFSVQIPEGKYTIRISATGFVPQTKSVSVKESDQAIFNVDLAPK
jgi:Carboxypeptidase regulatory-like domain